MNVPSHNEEQIVRRAVELLGGKHAFYAAAAKELGEINERWNQNVDVIGRILRAHLFAEHYLPQYLAQANPRLGSLAETRTTFAQKVALLDTTNPDVATLLPGIKRLNAIRNRLAHNLGAQVTQEDATIFLTCERFAALRAARSQEEIQTNNPLEILEDFARHTSVAFTYEFTPLTKAMAQAINEVHLGSAAI